MTCTEEGFLLFMTGERLNSLGKARMGVPPDTAVFFDNGFEIVP